MNRATPRPAPITGLFVVVTAVFVTSLITANVIAVKLIEPFGWIVPAGILIFPVTYIFGDILTEVYGYGRARQVIWLGFFCNLLFVLAVVATEHVGGAAGAWSEADQQAFHRILGYTARLLAASFAGYLVGEFINSFVLARLKVATEGRFLWLRTISSTVLGQAVDSAIFAAIAFGGEVPGPVLREIMWHNWVLKTAYEALATPVTYLIVNRLKAIEGVDVYDRETNWSPIVLPL
ncbi:MAG TPA: queuosine precursor transporter [Thermomicrobiales bacterium]|nr:queuosine precursor transporter [Thermomicrobiales bacterium]